MRGIRRVHPGIYLKDEIEARNLTKEEFASRSGISLDDIAMLISGKKAITSVDAMKLATYLDTSYEFWINLQNSYNSWIESQK